MEPREPAVLAVLVDGVGQRWFLAAVGLDGTTTPLLRSEDGDLAACQGLGFDDQVSFLRHRLCGVLQRGHDRLWPVGKKACQFAVLFAGALPGAGEQVNRAVAAHFAEWLLSPPVVAFAGGPGSPDLQLLAGAIDRPIEDALRAGLGRLFEAAADPAGWEVSTRKGTWQPGTG